MRKMARLLVLLIVAGLIAGSFSVSYAAKDPQKYPADISDAQAAQLVKEAIEKYKKHNTICYCLETSGILSMYGYDFENNIGAVLSGVSNTDYDYRKITENNNSIVWIDGKNLVVYMSDYNIRDELEYEYIPITAENAKEFLEEDFGDLVKTRERGFLLADTYKYSGIVWETAAMGEKHMCYRIDVPESDASLYADDEDYLPKRIYIGVDDGEIYRIDEERYDMTPMDIQITRYQTHFWYPESLVIPEAVRKNSDLSLDFNIIKKGITYGMSFSSTRLGDSCMYAWGTELPYSEKTLEILSYIKIRDKKYPVEEIGSSAFQDFTTITKLKISNTVKAINSMAFYGCSNLKSITFGKKLVRIDEYAFANCKKLSSVKLPDSVKEIGKKAFSGCKNMRSATIGKHVYNVGSKAFGGCTKLKTLRIKNAMLRKFAKSAKGRKKLGISKNTVIK